MIKLIKIPKIRETKNEYCVTYYGNNITEREFYEKFLTPMIERLFGLKTKIKSFKNTCYLRIYSKKLVEFKSRIIGLPIGSKSKLTHLPKIIVSQGTDSIKYMLAGLFDSDGSVSLIRKDDKLYPVLSITLKNKKIIKQVKEILTHLSIKCNCYKDRRYDRRIKKFTTVWKLYINGFRNLMKFIDQIPIKNPNHLRKIELLRKQAY